MAHDLDPSLEVSHNQAQQRYELHRESELVGHMDAQQDGEKVLIPHLEIAPEHRNNGWGTAFALRAVRMVRESGFEPVATCPFVASVLKRHPES